ncbi:MULTISPECIES: response regulator transcription factor [Paraburkholderia]|uniref:Virulence factors putative positive transcription regulator BvgA n=1 Tax=Paraburkholderia fynbosensis TaxID=1200993 RepID=A0A6J5GL07_9BURK|nr:MULTISPECIES: response regulator transcription factor [Paraburkholderia]RKT20596.1 LuxR family two component transcriptional regulator [Paraburkholderia sp. RAU2J]CAB3800819.1 Virulence factors putative positive transcription regulator BvgA [Paraburkholderia fynbosensis]
MSTILVIDDHPAFRMVIKMQLMQLLGIEEVIEADNGQTAVELARQHTPKLAILDLDIPRISGLDVIPRLKLAHPPIRMLVLSGHDPATFAPRAMRCGVHGFVSKSQEMKEIMRGVEAVLAGYSVFPVTTTSGLPPAHGASVDEEERVRLLSDKELVILQMLSKGMSNKAIGDALFISNKTVSSHKTRIMQKVGAKSLVELIDLARRCRIASTQ